MNNSNKSTTNNRTNKMGSAILCGALIVSLSTGTAFASDFKVVQSESIAISSDIGESKQSSDGGKTWESFVPTAGKAAEEPKERNIQVVETKSAVVADESGKMKQISEESKHSSDGGKHGNHLLPLLIMQPQNQRKAMIPQRLKRLKRHNQIKAMIPQRLKRHKQIKAMIPQMFKRHKQIKAMIPQRLMYPAWRVTLTMNIRNF